MGIKRNNGGTSIMHERTPKLTGAPSTDCMRSTMPTTTRATTAATSTNGVQNENTSGASVGKIDLHLQLHSVH